MNPRLSDDPEAGPWLAVRVREKRLGVTLVMVRDYPRIDGFPIRYYTRDRTKALRFDNCAEALGFIRTWNRFPRPGLRLGAEKIGEAEV